MHAVLAGAIVAWFALLLTAVALPALFAIPIYAIGSLICHQVPERSFHLGAFQLPVCARCLGIYAGAAAGALLAVTAARGWRHDARRLLIAAAVPSALTFLAEWFGVWHPSNIARAVAGVPLGVAVALVVVGAATLHYDRCTLGRPLESPRPPTPI